MKYTCRIRLLLLAAIAFLSMLAPAAMSAQEIFDNLTSHKGVECTYISGRFSHRMPYWRPKNSSEFMDLSDGFSSLYSYNIYSAEALKQAESILESHLRKNKDLELVMSKRQQQTDYRVYEKYDPEGKLLQMVIWNRQTDALCEIVVINWDKDYKRSDSTSFNKLPFNMIYSMQELPSCPMYP